MTNLKQQTFSVLAAGAMLLNVASPVLAGTTLEISGNASDSDSEVRLEVNNTTEVKQNNDANINNNINVNSNTGKNGADDNTGGDVKIDTGDANTTVDVVNSVNSNSANVDCCASNGDTEVLVSGNGNDSDNKVKLSNNNYNKVKQDNDADVDNDVDVDSNTGKNNADDNTGGNVKIDTGSATTTVTVGTQANSNWAKVGGSSNGGSLTARIIENASDSDNEIKLDFDNSVYLEQDNDADVDNDIDVDSNTGENEADDNTGGDVMIDTGDATTTVTVDNMVNFNAADVNCGCLLEDVLAKIAGNGTDSDNEIKAYFDDWQEVEQDNDADLDNDVDADSNTGENDADDNTGPAGTDPAIDTGAADTEVNVENSGNSNAFGVDMGDVELPGGLTFNFSFDFGMFLDWLSDQG